MRKFLAIICVCIVVLGVVFLYSMAKIKEQKKKLYDNVTLFQVTQGDISNEIVSSGYVYPSQIVKVGAQVDGQIKKILVKEGDFVTKGDILVEVDPAIQKSDLKNKEAQLSNARLLLEVEKIKLYQYKKIFERQRKLKKDGSGIPLDYDEAKSNLEMQFKNVEASKATVLQAETSVESAVTNLEYTTITAPSNGKVISIISSEGQTLVSSQNSPTLLVLANTSIMSIEAQISEADIFKVKKGQHVRFIPSGGESGLVYNGVIESISDVPKDFFSDSSSQSVLGISSSPVFYSCKVYINNDKGKLKTGMRGNVYITGDERKKVLTIPTSALTEVSKQGDNYVLKRTEDGFKKILITTGLRNDDYVEVLNGLKKSDLIARYPWQLSK
ncbi:efflux RND transporter periplasmic adaptor subunit [Escherichia marmotae]|uniref:efflux RND transporter periplasmic adaptor subunit n=1 Tax=Escherichia marmotae TaxID=1499973 RepID=UPI002814671B|nr:efflux RND transporter periplasmic adaptor subunit [Escherichia marmotae]MDQ9306121.1 efflux RND transporter periplasmic adaptor subunit [Escherichia marmotae]